MLHHHQAYQTTQPPPTLDWHNLYDACLSADPTEQAAAYQRLSELLLPQARYCLYHRPGLQVDAADCVQEGLLDIWEKLTSRRGPRQQAQSFKQWCITIIRRRVFDLLRRRANRVQQMPLGEIAEGDLSGDTVVDPTVVVVDRVVLDGLMGELFNHTGLNAIQRQILWLQCVEEQEYGEIAKRLQRNETTIRVNRHCAIVALQKDTVFMTQLGATLSTLP